MSDILSTPANSYEDSASRFVTEDGGEASQRGLKNRYVKSTYTLVDGPNSGSVVDFWSPVVNTGGTSGSKTPADGTANPTDATDSESFGMLWNGTTWDRVRSVSPTADPGNTGVSGAALIVSDGTNLKRLFAGSNVADSTAAGNSLSVTPMVWNGSFWDRTRGIGDNTDGVTPVGTGAAITLSRLTGYNGGQWDRIFTASGNPIAQGVLATASGTRAVVSLTAQSSIQNGTVLDNGVARSHHTCVITASTSLSGGVVALQGSLDNSTYVNIATLTLSGAGPFAIGTPADSATSPVAFRFIRVAITTTISGGTITATIASNS